MLWVVIIIAIIGLDQLTKFVISNKLVLGGSVSVIDKFFYITHWENKGAAWSILQNGRYFFIIITFIVASILAYMLYKSDNKLFKFSVSFIIGGAIGNLIDRIYKGSVTDFLQFFFGSYQFPVFNVADSCVCIGTMLLAYYLLFVYKDKENENPIVE